MKRNLPRWGIPNNPTILTIAKYESRVPVKKCICITMCVATLLYTCRICSNWMVEIFAKLVWIKKLNHRGPRITTDKKKYALSISVTHKLYNRLTYVDASTRERAKPRKIQFILNINKYGNILIIVCEYFKRIKKNSYIPTKTLRQLRVKNRWL